MENELFPVDNYVNPVDKLEKKPKKEKLSSEQFFIFWKAYPRKIGKYLAQRVWSKLDNEDGLFQKIMSALQVDKESKSWFQKGGIYIPYPATWLNQKRWEDHEPPKLTQAQVDKMEQAKARMEAIKEKEYLRIQGGLK